MKVKRYTLAVSALLLGLIAAPTMAATFQVPRSFEIMYVDLESASMFGGDFKVDVDEGEHQIVVRFNKLLRSGGDTQEFQSEPIVLNLTFDKNTYLTLKAPYISSQKQAEANAKDPQFTIYDDVTGQEVDYKHQQLATKSGLQNTRDYLVEVEKLAEKGNAETSESSKGPVSAPIIMSDNVPLDMMQYWYNHSDEATRKAERIWLADNMYKPTVSNIQLDMFQFWHKRADEETRKAFKVWLAN